MFTPISGRNKTIIAKSTMESEFIALELAGNETKQLRNFLANIPLGLKPTPYVSMHCAFQAAISIAKNNFQWKEQTYSIET